MKEEHIILRNLSTMTSNDVFAGPHSMRKEIMPVNQNLVVDIKAVDRKGLPEIKKNSDVVAIAPSIPIQLIKPYKQKKKSTSTSKKKKSPTPKGVTWGIKAVKADTTPFTGDGVVIAVLDTGIDRSHAAFDDPNLEIIERDFTGEGNGDTNGHGTHCAGTIFGRSVDDLRIGVAPGIKKVLIGKVLGEKGGGSTSMIIQAIQWAIDNGAHIISMSLGIDFPGYVKLLESRRYPTELAVSIALEGYRANVRLFESLAAYIRNAGSFGQTQSTLIIAAAGNESRRDQDPNFEIAVSPPAVAEGIISVAAIGKAGKDYYIAPFSNTGANVAAPGVDILSAKAGVKNGLISEDGTSMAAPHVAGVAALWAEKLLKTNGVLNFGTFDLRLRSSATTQGFKAGIDPTNYGEGLVCAPQQ